MFMPISNTEKARRVTRYLAEGKNEKIKAAILALMDLSPAELAELNRITNG
jgi:hypothetical protein